MQARELARTREQGHCTRLPLSGADPIARGYGGPPEMVGNALAVGAVLVARRLEVAGY